MACRVKNTSQHTVRLDLRDGETLYLHPGAVSRPLREEMLYGNSYVSEWEAAGVIQRLGARMADVIEAEKRGRPAAADVSGATDVMEKTAAETPETAGEPADEAAEEEEAKTAKTKLEKLAAAEAEMLPEVEGEPEEAAEAKQPKRSRARGKRRRS